MAGLSTIGFGSSTGIGSLLSLQENIAKESISNKNRCFFTAFYIFQVVIISLKLTSEFFKIDMQSYM